MTREEAIKIIDCYDIGFYDLSGVKIPADKLADAFDMAIEALQAEPIKHGEWIKFEDCLPRRKQRVIFLERDNVSQKYNIDLGMFCWKDEKENDYSDSVAITNRKWHATDSRIIAWCPLPPLELATNCGAKMDKD